MALCLLLVFILTGHSWNELIGATAVLFTFGHASVGFRLEEAQALLAQNQGKATVECYKKMHTYFLLKECCWLVYFITLGAYSALVGVGIFLLYARWRSAWRTYHAKVT